MTAFHELYRPNQEERARQAFVGTLKATINQTLEPALTERYEHDLLPRHLAAGGAAPDEREAARRLFEPDPLFQLWGSLTYTSQDRLWEACGEAVARLRPQFEARAAQIEAGGERLGSLSLNPGLAKPEPIGSVDIHRQPGGYFLGDDSADLTAALWYMATVEIYRGAKGFRTTDSGSTESGLQFAAMLRDFDPDLAPRRILELGCGVGHMAIGLKQAFPEAEVHGVDLSGPFVRAGHLWAEDMGIPVHFRQADARDTGLESGSFDLIVSQILFHETWHDVLPGILQEAQRLLAPGGLFFNVDVPYQPERLTTPQKVTHAWQEQYNGEPFWVGFVDTDVRSALTAAGFPADRVFSDYRAPGGGRPYFIFGGYR